MKIKFVINDSAQVFCTTADSIYRSCFLNGLYEIGGLVRLGKMIIGFGLIDR